MKKLFSVLAIAALTFISIESRAQAFDKSTKLVSINIGPGEMIHFPVGNNNPYSGANLYGYNYNFNRTIITGQLNVQAEFAVHRYVGVGFAIGIGGRAQGGGGLAGAYGAYDYGYFKEINVPIAVLANFHFYQLIADKKKNSSKLHADKLDIYAGVTAGSGVAIHPYKKDGGENFNDALFYFGPHAGVNYYFAKNIAVTGEVGWGVTLVQAGIVFKLGGKK